jgi:tetratricopeptide (TPR) repeat protein
MSDEHQDHDAAAEEHTPQGYFQRGVQLIQDGYTQAALEAFQQSSLLGGGHSVSVNYNLACCYAALGQYDHALELVRWLIDSNSSRGDLRESLFWLYYVAREERADLISHYHDYGQLFSDF